LQPHKLFIFRPDCFEAFFTRFDFFVNQGECLKYTMSKGIGYAIIVASAILKLPQILKIVQSQSVDGISKFLFYIEVFMYLHTSAYSLHKGVHFSVYGENAVIGVQNLIIIILYWKYNKSIQMKEKILCTLFFLAYCVLLLTDKVIPENVWRLIVSSNILVSKNYLASFF